MMISVWMLPLLTVVVLTFLSVPEESFAQTWKRETREEERSSDKTAYSCGNGWQKHGNTCYKVTKKVSGDDAPGVCTAFGEGSQIASILNQKEFDFIKNKYPNLGNTWIGLKDLSTTTAQGTHVTRIWKWNDGSKYKFMKWNPREPNNYGGDEKCVHIYAGTGHHWNDNNCDRIYPALCKKPLAIPKGYQKMANLPVYLKVGEGKKNWTDARAYCQGDDPMGRTDLVVIDSDAKNSEVTRFGKSNNAWSPWIGLTQNKNERWTYSWVSGSQIKASKGKLKNDGKDGNGYQYWFNKYAIDEDKYDDEECIYSTGRWQDYYCSDKDNFICEFVP